MAKKNLSTKTTMENLAVVIKDTLAYKEDIPVNVSELTNDANYQNATQVEAAIAAQVGRSYRPSGSIAFEELPELVAANLGKVYNITNGFTTTADFVEGAGKKHKAGADVGIVEVQGESVGEVVYKYNVFGNFVDLSAYMEKITGGTTNALVKQDANGQVVDTGIAADDVVTKVSGATAGNIATLDANGKLADGGIAANTLLVEGDIEDYTVAEIRALLARS